MTDPFRIAVMFMGLGLVLAGCDSGPSEDEFIAACVQARNQTQESCSCAAREAKASLPTSAWQALVLDMQGKGAEAKAITDKMTGEEQSAYVKGTIDMARKCLLK